MNPLDFYKVLLRTKKVQKGFLAKKMIPPVLRTFGNMVLENTWWFLVK